MRSPFLRLWLLKEILSLPPAVLRFFSGSGVIYSDGRTLDPRLQFLWRTWFSTPRPLLSLSDKSLEQARQEWQDMATTLGLPSDIRVKFETIGSEASGIAPYAAAAVEGLLIRPARIADDAPVLVFFHQGGGVLGGTDLSRAFCALLAHTARCPVFLPKYRLAPAHRFPAALEDARLALDWAQANAFRLGAKSGEIAVGGILIGANLAARLCLDLKRDFKPMPVAQLLITPLIDLSDRDMNAPANRGLWPITAEDIALMMSHYAGAGTDLSDPRLSPALESFLVGQPRSFIVSAGLDPLAPQAEAFAKRLIAARNRVIYRRYDPLPLGFDLFVSIVDEARAATEDIARQWVDLLRSGKSEPDAEQNVA